MIQSVYSDNTVARQTVHLNVVPTANKLKKFKLDQGAGFVSLVLEDEDRDRQQLLRPIVTYNELTYPIYLNDYSQLKLSLKPYEGNPVIRIDKDRMVHA